MTLRLHKVSKQIDRLQESAVARAEKLRADLPKVRRGLDLAAERADLAQKAKTEAERGWNGAMPACGEAIAFRKSAPAAPAALALVAVDGSQVYPDRHSASLFYAINIGYFILRSDSGETAADSEPAVFFEDESLFPDGNLISQTILNARRTVDEMSVLARLATAEHAAAPGRPVFALADGGFALRIDEKTFPPAERESLQKRFFAAIDSLARAKIPAAGYIARPGGSPVLSLIDLALDPSPKGKAGRGGRAPFPGLDDRVLFETLLAPGERSALFEFASYWNDLYRNREPNQSAHFFYLNVGQRYPVIARVEIPEWTAKDSGLVDRVHAALVEQSSVTLNDPYPYALIRADEEAFVSGEEKQYLEEQMAVTLIRGGLRFNRSEKLSHKGRARKH
ncbi:MAG: DNA double-strand break repair nuclease NurA [Anaerolineales bacterium]|nr:DNA double-strand break repair nuclease NurA [Anaerolineales bacterium]